MIFAFRKGALMLALAGGVGIAAAQTTATQPVELTPEQRTTIYRIVSKEKIRTPPPANMLVSVGGEIPASVELYTLPGDVLDQVPVTKLYRYTLVNRDVVIVDPTTMKVVEIIRE